MKKTILPKQPLNEGTVGEWKPEDQFNSERIVVGNVIRRGRPEGRFAMIDSVIDKFEKGSIFDSKTALPEFP